MKSEDGSDLDKHITRREGLMALAYAVILLWVNAYVCRDLFGTPASHMNSMQGFWIALAKRAGNSWFWPDWWPYFDCGIPFEFAYAPLVPALTALGASIRGIPHAVAFQSVSGLAYCAGPVTLFVMAWLLTRAPGYSFAAALLYSLTAPTQLIVPDAAFSWQSFWDARRLFLISVWDDTPHLTALVFFPLAVLFLALAIRRGGRFYYVAAVLSIALMTLASDFGPTLMAMAAFCLLFVLPREDLGRNIAVTAVIGVAAYAIVSPFLSPTEIGSIHRAAVDAGEGWTMGSVTALAIVVLGWVVLWRYLPRWTKDWRVQFFALFAYLASSIPILFSYLHRRLLPQPSRYKFEMEMALPLVLVFGLRPVFERASKPLKAALIFLLVALAGEQVVGQRHAAKALLRSEDVTRKIEYRTAVWAERNLPPGTRVMMPGSIGQWTDAFTNLMQFSGGSWSVAYNGEQQWALRAIWNGGDTPERDARVSLAYLKAYGVGAIAVSGPKSQEFWKAYAHPAKFDGVLPLLWREDDVSIYRVPQRSGSLAHVVPRSAIVVPAPRGDSGLADLERYDAALDDPSLPLADLRWEGRNRVRISAPSVRGQVISVQVTYHPGWHATAGGQARRIERDGLGLMWLDPGCSGACEIQLDYDGGWELRICRVLSYGVLFGLVVVMVWRKPSDLMKRS